LYISDLAERFAPSTRITVLTGAGVSAASGVPTFRGPGGLWRHRRPEDLATPEAFAREPRVVWEWYAWRRGLLADCRPNRAHAVLADWSRRFPRFTLVTQNVDGLHEAAGTRDVIRLHGSIWLVRCHTPCQAGATPWHDDSSPPPQETVAARELPPRCPHCGGLIRPAVVWFGEPLDPGVLGRAVAAADCDLFFAIGTSAVVYPAAGLIDEARRCGAFTVEINPAATSASDAVDLAVPQPAETALDLLDQAILELKKTGR
jgi:NAD-dependent deacetylase